MAGHSLYDELDPLYREIWGHSLHHGLWCDGSEDIDQALQNLSDLVASLLPAKGTIADVGCGYGTLAHLLADQPGLRVLANTNSPVQASRIPSHPSLEILEGDWLAQVLENHSLDAAVAVESLSHFPSFTGFLEHTLPALKDGGSLVIADWFSDSGTTPLLRHLAASGDLPAWRSLESLVTSAQRLGVSLRSSRDLSPSVAPTWTRIFGRSLALPFRHPRLVPQLVGHVLKRPALLTAFPLLRLAYHSGDLRYHLLTFQK
jgi:tocopherol O-methyltransferase